MHAFVIQRRETSGSGSTYSVSAMSGLKGMVLGKNDCKGQLAILDKGRHSNAL